MDLSKIPTLFDIVLNSQPIESTVNPQQQSAIETTDTENVSDLDFPEFSLTLTTKAEPTQESTSTEESKTEELSPVKLVIDPNKRGINVTPEQLKFLVTLLKLKGEPVKITSLERPGAKTSNGSDSWHATSQAMDLVPESGDFTNLLELLKNDQDIRYYMQSIGVGYIDETNPEMLAKVGGTWPNIHIGPDLLAIKTFNNV